MIATGTLDLDGSLRINRWAPYRVEIDFVGQDFTGATFAAHFRRFRDAAGDPLITLGNSTAPAEGISVSVATDDGITTSTVQIRINETTIEGLPFTSPRGGDFELVWDLHVTTSGHKVRWLEGRAPIKAGATQ